MLGIILPPRHSRAFSKKKKRKHLEQCMMENTVSRKEVKEENLNFVVFRCFAKSSKGITCVYLSVFGYKGLYIYRLVVAAKC